MMEGQRLLLLQKGRATNGEIKPVTDKIYEIWSCSIFVI